MKSFRSFFAALSLVAPLAADPLGLVVLNGNSPGSVLRYTANGFTTIANLPSAATAMTRDAFGNYLVASGVSLTTISPTGAVTPVPLPLLPLPPTWVSIAYDAQGHIVAADNTQHSVWLITPQKPAGLVTKIASYPVTRVAQAEDVSIVVGSDGNYLLLEDNTFGPVLYSITPGGAVTPIPLTTVPVTGAFMTSAISLISDGAGNYLFASYIQDSIYRLTPAGVVTRIADSVANDFTDHIASLALNPDTGDILVSTVLGRVLDMTPDGSFVRTLSRPATANEKVINMIAETYGDLPHLAAGDVWTTGFYIVNSGNQPARYLINFYGDSGAPVQLPFADGSSSSLSGVLPAKGMTYIEAGDPTKPLAEASGLINADPTISIQALFRDHSPDGNYYEAGVPTSSGGTAFTIPFDATTFAPTGAPLYTGFALANLDPNTPATVICTATDHSGANIPNGVTIPVLSPLGHWANYQFPALTGKQGTLNCSSNTVVAAVALRFIGSTAFSTLPVLYK